jgi:hypothetical protein
MPHKAVFSVQLSPTFQKYRIFKKKRIENQEFGVSSLQ